MHVLGTACTRDISLTVLHRVGSIAPISVQPGTQNVHGLRYRKIGAPLSEGPSSPNDFQTPFSHGRDVLHRHKDHRPRLTAR
jgi:hypothetical protein